MPRIVIYILYLSLAVAQPGILNVGFDVDDTILFSRDVFLSLPDDKRDPVDYGWINSHDKEFSLFITPTVELINYFSTSDISRKSRGQSGKSYYEKIIFEHNSEKRAPKVAPHNQVNPCSSVLYRCTIMTIS